ncbi:hypothetical protein MR642_01340 [bacterium]|nr:hypothetical protein [bacterium]
MKKEYICPSLYVLALHTEQAVLGLSDGETLRVNGGFGKEQLSRERSFGETAFDLPETNDY